MHFKGEPFIINLSLFRFEKTKETSPCAQCGLKCCICCFYCLEKFIRYMNHNAYTVIAIEGTHFCNAARIVNTIYFFIFILVYFSSKLLTLICLILGLWNDSKQCSTNRCDQRSGRFHSFPRKMFCYCRHWQCRTSFYETRSQTAFLCRSNFRHLCLRFLYCSLYYFALWGILFLLFL